MTQQDKDRIDYLNRLYALAAKARREIEAAMYDIDRAESQIRRIESGQEVSP